MRHVPVKANLVKVCMRRLTISISCGRFLSININVGSRLFPSLEFLPHCVFGFDTPVVDISRWATRHKVIVSRRRVKHGKGHSGGESSEGCTPLTGLDRLPVQPAGLHRVRERKRGGPRVNVCHAVSSPPLTAVPAVPGGRLPAHISCPLRWHTL